VAYSKKSLAVELEAIRVSLEGGIHSNCTILFERGSVQDTDSLKPGDLYVVLGTSMYIVLSCEEVRYSTCEFVHGAHPCYGPKGKHPSYIVSQQPSGYSYNAWETHRILEVGYVPVLLGHEYLPKGLPYPLGEYLGS
jgi:hypothetical protein